MGVSVEAYIEKWGFYPRGGGRVQLKINPVNDLKPISLIDRGSLKKIRGLSVVSHLPAICRKTEGAGFKKKDSKGLEDIL